jgi:hypothetical protein
MHGTGKYFYADGRVYEGKFEGGKKQGYGVMTWTKGPKKGEKYEGEWKDDKMDGYGIYTYPNGKKVEGQWKDGKWYGNVKAGQAGDNKGDKADTDKLKKGGTGVEDKKADTDSLNANKSGEVPEKLYTEYIYIQKDWQNWQLVDGGLEKLLKDKTLQIEFIDGTISKAKFKKIFDQREIGFNRWKRYWNVELDGKTISSIPETSVWRIKVLKDNK